MPDSVEMPAPVKTRMRRAWRSQGSAAARPGVGAPSMTGIGSMLVSMGGSILGLIVELLPGGDSLLSPGQPRIDVDDHDRVARRCTGRCARRRAADRRRAR